MLLTGKLSFNQHWWLCQKLNTVCWAVCLSSVPRRDAPQTTEPKVKINAKPSQQTRRKLRRYFHLASWGPVMSSCRKSVLPLLLLSLRRSYAEIKAYLLSQDAL